VIIKKLQENFSDVSKKRAKVIAGNESNRVFTLSQFEADEQFLAQNKLTKKAYKRLISNTGHPCPICNALIKKTHAHPIPFKQDFAEFGKEMVVKYEEGGKQKTAKFTPDFEHLRSGHIHVNCHCRYELLIKKDDGTWLNSNTGKIENDVDFEPDLHPRDKKGRFAKKGTDIADGIAKLDLSKLNTKQKFDKFVKDSDLDYGTAEARAARVYQSHHFYKLNEGFQLGEQKVTVNNKTINLDQFANTFDPTFDIEVEKDTVLYRGVSQHPNDFPVGESVFNDGYTSTSTVEGTARKKFKGPGGSVIHLTIPKGTKIAIPDLIARDITKKSMDEQEAVLQRGAEYIVDRVEGDIVYAHLV
jgi:hypothetical protein